MKRNILTEIIAALFILLFAYTAISKFLEFSSFRTVLHMSPLIGDTASIVAWGLPLTEIAISLLLFFPRTRRKGFWASLIIMTLFTIYLTYMIYFTPIRPCNCGGVLQQMTWKQHLIFNTFFTLLAGIGLWWDKRNLRLANPSVTYSATS
jgi:putative oxidoreductase